MTEHRTVAARFSVLGNAGPVPAALRGGVVAIGNFDGVHRGHQAVAASVISQARASGCAALALTFEPHPRAFFDPKTPLFRLSDRDTKLRLLAATGLDGAAVLTFDAALAALPAAAFVRDVLVERLHISRAVIGYNFHFGKGREGSPEFLATEGRRHGFSVEVLEPQLLDGVPVSSSAIRAHLEEGRVEAAATLLGRPWMISGPVIHGEKRGRDLGYPTANIRLDPGCRLRHGIYAVQIGHQGRVLHGVASFGRRPTFDNGAPLLETFVFDFKGDLYGAPLDIAFVGWIRPELRFDGIDALVRQMDDDSAKARAILAAAPDPDFPPLLEAP